MHRVDTLIYLEFHLTHILCFFTTLNKGIGIKIMNLKLMFLLTDAFYKTL